MAVNEKSSIGGDINRLSPGWNLYNKERGQSEIIYGKRVQPHQLQGPAQQIQGAQMQAAQTNPALLAQRQKMIQGQRDDASRRMTAQRQVTDDAIARRFAQLGSGGGGAAMGVQLKAQRDLADQEAGQMAQLGEREAGMQMSAEEAQAAREQAAAGQNLQNQMQQQIFNAESAKARDLYNVEALNKAEALQEASALQRAGMLLDLDTTEFNKGVARSQSGGGK